MLRDASDGWQFDRCLLAFDVQHSTRAFLQLVAEQRYSIPFAWEMNNIARTG